MRRVAILKMALSSMVACGICGTTKSAWSGQVKSPSQANGPQTATPQSLPGQPGYYGYTQSPWFASPGIQQQLSLSNEQMTKLNQAYQQNWNDYSKGLNGLGAINEPERLKRIQDLSGNLNGQLGQTAQGVLKQSQYDRYQQLNLQHQGLNAFNDALVQDKLKLNADQLRRIHELGAKQNQMLTDLQRQAAVDPTAAAQQFQDFRRQNDLQLNSILTEQQRQTWQQLIGQPYDFTPDAFRIPKR